MNFFQRLFSQPKVEAVKNSQPAEELVKQPPSVQHSQTIGLDQLPPGLHVGKLSDVGRERERNEDSFYTIESLVQHEYGPERFGLFIVADGMGGHQKGEIASSLSARITANSILENVYLPYLTNSQGANNLPLNEALKKAVQAANTTVQEEVPDGGTTLTVALVMGNNAYIAHVGDSRAYVFNQGEIKQITEDHSLARRLEETGQATAEEVMHVQNVLYKAIGQGGAIEVDTYIQHLPAGALLLLCSDGLWGLVNNEQIKETLASAPTPQKACENLVAMANENGGRDNITAIVVAVGAND